MNETAAMRKEAKRINKFRSRYNERPVMYYPAGTDFEAPGVIKDMVYDACSWDARTNTWGTWSVFIEYETRNGKETGWRSLAELEPVGWTA